MDINPFVVIIVLVVLAALAIVVNVGFRKKRKKAVERANARRVARPMSPTRSTTVRHPQANTPSRPRTYIPTPASPNRRRDDDVSTTGVIAGGYIAYGDDSPSRSNDSHVSDSGSSSSGGWGHNDSGSSSSGSWGGGDSGSSSSSSDSGSSSSSGGSDGGGGGGGSD